MHRTCTVQAYDFFGQIMVSVVIRDHDAIAPELGSGDEYITAATIPSTSEAEPCEWLQQALLGLLEAL